MHFYQLHPENIDFEYFRLKAELEKENLTENEKRRLKRRLRLLHVITLEDGKLYQLREEGIESQHEEKHSATSIFK